MGLIHDPDYVAALGPVECAKRDRERAESDRIFGEKTAPILAAQGYRWPNKPYPENVKEGARFVWLKIDNREIDDGLCKVWVVPL